MHSSPQSTALFDHSTMTIVVVDHQGKIKSINPFGTKLFGYETGELTGHNIEVLIPARYHTSHVLYRTAYSDHPKNRAMGTAMELYAIRKNGIEFPVEVSLGHYQMEGDYHVIAFINDITIRKNAEIEIKKLNDQLELLVEQRTDDLKETLHQLKLSSTKLEDALLYQKALLDNAGAIIIATDQHGVIKLFNPEACQSLGYSEAEVIDLHTPALFHDKKEIINKRLELYNEFGIVVEDDFSVLVERSKRSKHEEEQFTYIRKSGTSFPISLTITGIKDGAGQVTGYLGIAIDISERIKVEKALQAAFQKEKMIGDLKTGFISMASHEFRTPLSTVLSSAYLIDKYTTTEDQPMREKHLHRIVSSVNMLTDILNDFLSVGKIEEGKIQVKITEFDIEQEVLKIADEIRHTLKKQQELRCVHQGSPLVTLDRSLLKHIVLNLVSNAGKFSPDQGEIEIKTICCDHTVLLIVKDNGMGISPEDQQHLTTRFFRGSNAGNIQGTGLGLHLVAKYAELMNGTVQCKSEVKKGTEFTITFNTNIYHNEKDFAD